MDTTVVQVRDLPTDVVAALKARGQSLAAYLRDLLTDEAAKSPIEDVMATNAERTPVPPRRDRVVPAVTRSRSSLPSLRSEA